MLLSILCGLLFVVTPTLSARILGIVSVPSYSHQIAFRPLWRELSLRGHQLTVMTTDPMRDLSLTNLSEIDLHFSYETWNRKISMNEMARMNMFEMFNRAITLSSDVIEEQLQYYKVQDLLKNSTETYDLVMVESFFPAMVAVTERFNCPLIQILSLDGTSYIYGSIGNPSHPILNPDFLSTISNKSNFFQRLTTTFNNVFFNYYYFPRLLNAQDFLVRKYFGDDYPPLENILSKTSMLYLNTDNVFHKVRPLLPNVIQFGGGTHLTSPKPLPKDLQNVLDNAKNGFIYFSLGSNVKSKLLPENVRKVLLETFAELSYIVLWKFEQENLPGRPENVHISKWFPQQDIFRHPNIKLFITQGGLQSSEEAIYSHIPIIGIPFIADQQFNIEMIVEKGMGLSADINNLEKESFKKSILEVINNPKYRNKVIEVAALAKDQPQSGIERAVWWTEYVLRHNGAKHLRSPVLDLPGYQYYLLDVIGFCLLVLLGVGYVLIKLFQFIYKLVKDFTRKDKLKTL